jgi:hypothetical protein
MNRNPIDVPIRKPRKDHQKRAQLEREEYKAEVQDSTMPSNQLPCAVKTGRGLR